MNATQRMNATRVNVIKAFIAILLVLVPFGNYLISPPVRHPVHLFDPKQADKDVDIFNAPPEIVGSYDQHLAREDSSLTSKLHTVDMPNARTTGLEEMSKAELIELVREMKQLPLSSMGKYASMGKHDHRLNDEAEEPRHQSTAESKASLKSKEEKRDAGDFKDSPKSTDGWRDPQKSKDQAKKGNNKKPNKAGPSQDQCPVVFASKYPLQHWKRVHYVHVPKSGGTAFGQVLRKMICSMNAQRGSLGDGLDCCMNTTFWCTEWSRCRKRPDCLGIHGCRLCDCRHTPQLRYMKAAPSVAILRNPVSRAISGFLFRGHSPNWDRFNVRKEFPNHPSGKEMRVFSYDDYLGFPEYHNIITRMIARDQFPYQNISVSRVDKENAMERLARFQMIGIQEAFNASVHLLFHKFGVRLSEDVWRETVSTNSYKGSMTMSPAEASDLKGNIEVQASTERANHLDVEVYNWALKRFCDDLCEANLLEHDTQGICLKIEDFSCFLREQTTLTSRSTTVL